MRLGFRKRADHGEASAASGSSDSISQTKSDEAGVHSSVCSTAIDPDEITEIQAVDHLKHFRNEHGDDMNMPREELDEMDDALRTGNLEKELAVEHELLEDDSPYPEVRAAVRNYDVDMPSNTIRAWFIGMFLCTVGSGVNMLFSLRSPSISLSTYAIQLVAYPMGLLWDVIFPDRVFHAFGHSFNFKPGPFNFKEHVIIVVMANAAYAGGAAYATDVLITQKVFYNQSFGWAFQILFILTSQMNGYGLAGISRRWLVWPAAMIWPSNLVNCQLFYALHDHSPSDPAKTNGWRIGRYKWFMCLMAASFCWYWFPGWIFQALSYFTFACWIAPQNAVVNQLFGGVTGLGLIPITFDWTIISGFLGSPLVPPWFAIANTLVGLFIFIVLTAVGVKYTGAWYGKYLPMQDNQSYDNTGGIYNVTRILTPEKHLDVDAYRAYSPIFLSTNFALTYGISFAAIASVITHTYLYHGKDIWRRWKQARNQEDDIHMKLAKNYRDAPDWWYLSLMALMIALSFVVITVWDTGFPWWALIVCLAIPLVWVVPAGIIQAATNITVGLNVITEFTVGYMVPGRPIAMMMFKTYGYITMAQALGFIADLKLGHYMKVPPRTMFQAQVVATVWSCIIQIAVMNWALATIDGICETDQPDHYSCPGGHVFYTASVIWGLIGPARIFSPGAVYQDLMWYFLIGAGLPIITWFMSRRYPKSVWKYAMAPVMFGGLGALPPATVYIFLCWGIVGCIFQRFIRQRYFGWWSQYNYITSAALDTGLVLSTIVIFFTLQLTNATPPQWWGNVKALETMDMMDTAILQKVPEGQTFGPATWS